MALNPIDEIHAVQIQAGTLGRRAGHAFEDQITAEINSLPFPLEFQCVPMHHVNRGDPARLLLAYVASHHDIGRIESAIALSTGALATSDDGRKWLNVNGVGVRRCKSDLILTLALPDGTNMTCGISTKQCNNPKPTNAQLFFTTALAFSNLLRANDISVSGEAVTALRQFCGDKGFRPLDDLATDIPRLTDPRRFFWEEINQVGRMEWESILTDRQDEVTRLLLQKAYMEDPFTPEFLLHKTCAAAQWSETEVAIYSIDELIDHSRTYGRFSIKNYAVRKGSYRDPLGVVHAAPRFGIVQMQRGGQAQHPDQLQFNLEAGYFYKIENFRPDVRGNRSRK